MTLDPIREVAETIVRLGISDPLTLAPFIHAHRQRQLSGSTQGDAEDEAREFLAALESGKVIDRDQAMRLVRLVDGDASGLPTPPATMPAGASDPIVGKRFGDYTLAEKIGEGGMGTVYRAMRDDGDRGFVVKLLSPLTADAASYVRFRREGEVMMALSHPNVVRVYQMGEHQGLCYIVMEYVDGSSLQSLIERKGRFPWADAAKAIRQIALGLEAAHQMGVIHRDVKPQNVLIDRARGALKVADFGLAKSSSAMDGTVSRAGDILGSPAYIAPEQWGDHDVDWRADLFALGVVFYQLLTGVLPFRGRSPADYARAILKGKFEPIKLYAPDTPDGIVHIALRLLERRREDRYPNAATVVADLERVLRGDLPDVPRLVRQGENPERWVLLGREHYDIGRDGGCAIVYTYPGVAEKHARLERTQAGVILRDLDAPGGTRVNGMRIREIALKDGDTIELAGAPALRYRSGAVVETAVPSSTPTKGIQLPKIRASGGPPPAPVVVPAIVYESLVRGRHPRAVLAMIELLDEETRNRRVERGRAKLVSAGVPPEEADRAKQRGAAILRRLATLIPDHLFQATRENLGADPSAWLAWWLGGAYERFPAQVLPPGSRGRGQLALSAPAEDGATVVTLKGAQQWVIGRGSEADIRLNDRSVSRKHAVVYRLLTRYAVKDEGSRFGTVLGGERRAVALLRDDDVFELGRAKIMFREKVPDAAQDARASSASGDPGGVEAALFDGMVELRSPHVVAALIAFLDYSRSGSVRASAVELELEDALPDLVKELVEQRRRAALEALPLIAKKNLGSDPVGWRAWWSSVSGQFPVQVAPEGYGI